MRHRAVMACTRLLSGRKLVIVVVNDEHDIRESICWLLEDEGYEVRTFAHPVPVRALQMMDEQPQLFVLDIMLPQMNGIALAG